MLDVLNFLGAHPTESFTLAQIARHVGLSNGSAHRILTTMAESRFLSRNERHKTYSLGIALVALGRAALEKHRGIEIARQEIAQLALELNAQWSVTAIADGELLLVAKEGAPHSHDGVHQGRRTHAAHSAGCSDWPHRLEQRAGDRILPFRGVTLFEQSFAQAYLRGGIGHPTARICHGRKWPSDAQFPTSHDLLKCRLWYPGRCLSRGFA